MGLSGLNCPLAVSSGIHSAWWQICSLKPLTSSSTWAVTLTTAASRSSFQCDALQLRCARVQRWEHEYQHTPSTRLEWGQLKGHEEGGVTRLDCKFSASDPRCTSRHSGAELWPAIRVCFPFLGCQKWHVKLRGPGGYRKTDFFSHLSAYKLLRHQVRLGYSFKEGMSRILAFSPRAVNKTVTYFA